MDTINLTKTELRAHQIWAVLLLLAKNRQIITYGGLGKLVGGVAASGFGDMFRVISRYCGDKDYPQITVLVVDKETAKPSKGSGFSDDDDEIQERFQKVFSYNWESALRKDKHPSVADFHRIWEDIRRNR